MRRDLTREVLLVVDDASEDERAAGAARDLDRLGHALVRMDAPEKEEVVAGALARREFLERDAMVDRGGVAKRGVAVGVADRDVRRAVVVALVDRHDPLR